MPPTTGARTAPLSSAPVQCSLCAQTFDADALAAHATQCYHAQLSSWLRCDASVRGPKPQMPGILTQHTQSHTQSHTQQRQQRQHSPSAGRVRTPSTLTTAAAAAATRPTVAQRKPHGDDGSSRGRSLVRCGTPSRAISPAAPAIGNATPAATQPPQQVRQHQPQPQQRSPLHADREQRSSWGAKQLPPLPPSAHDDDGDDDVHARGDPAAQRATNAHTRSGGSSGGGNGDRSGGDAQQSSSASVRRHRGERPMLPMCYLCGQQFGTTSIAIHIPQCYAKQHARWVAADPRTRGQPPRHPDAVDWRGNGRTAAEQVSAQYDEFVASLEPCPHCGRRFLADRLLVHLRSCRPGNSARHAPTTHARRDGGGGGGGATVNTDSGGGGGVCDDDAPKNGVHAVRVATEPQTAASPPPPAAAAETVADVGDVGRGGVAAMRLQPATNRLPTQPCGGFCADGRTCPQCGTVEYDTGAKYCRECGCSLTATLPRSTTAASAAPSPACNEVTASSASTMGTRTATHATPQAVTSSADDATRPRSGDGNDRRRGAKHNSPSARTRTTLDRDNCSDHSIAAKAATAAAAPGVQTAVAACAPSDDAAPPHREVVHSAGAHEGDGVGPGTDASTSDTSGGLQPWCMHCPACDEDAVDVTAVYCEECGSVLQRRLRDAHAHCGGGGGGGSSSSGDVTPAASMACDDAAEAVARETCPHCQRQFAPLALSRHVRVCARRVQRPRQRPVYDATRHRLSELEAAASMGHGGVSGSPTGKRNTHARRENSSPTSQKTQPLPVPQRDWRAESRAFRAAMRAAREVDMALRKGGNIKDLPPPTYDAHPEYVPCPHCGRRFASDVAERHIPRCANTINRPKPPPLQRA